MENKIENNPILIEKDNFKIRQLRNDEAQLYKSMRLEAIQSEPAMFRCSIPAEASLSDSEWEQRVRHPRFIFGLFEKEEFIGMTSLLLLSEYDAYLGQSYIKTEYRGKGLSSLLYEIRFMLAHELGLKLLSISHRESNFVSKAANQRYGFKYSHRESVDWLDGTTEDALYYTLELS